MKGLFGLFRPPRITQDQGAEALAACIVLSGAQGAEDYLNVRNWREAREMYSGDKVFLGTMPGSKDSVSGQFGARVTAVFGESRYSSMSLMAHISLKACLDAHRKNKIIDNILSRVDWRS